MALLATAHVADDVNQSFIPALLPYLIVQRQAVAAVQGVRLAGEAGPVQRAVEPLAAAVAGEDPAGPVGAVRPRREADQHQAGLRVAPAGDRPGPVVVVEKRALLHAPDLGAVVAQFRTPPAGDDAPLDRGE